MTKVWIVPYGVLSPCCVFVTHLHASVVLKAHLPEEVCGEAGDPPAAVDVRVERVAHLASITEAQAEVVAKVLGSGLHVVAHNALAMLDLAAEWTDQLPERGQ